MLVFEVIFVMFGKQVIDVLFIFMVGIGVGKDCLGQVLVLYDMFDIYFGCKVCFVCNFMVGVSGVQDVIWCYVEVVKSGVFLVFEYSFQWFSFLGFICCCTCGILL